MKSYERKHELKLLFNSPAPAVPVHDAPVSPHPEVENGKGQGVPN